VDSVRHAAGPRLEKCIIFDQYQGASVEKGFKSLSIGLIIRDVSRTLTDSDVESLTQSVLAELTDKYDAKLRG